MSVEDEPDRLPGAPHPRERERLFGHEALERAFATTVATGRLHHAWIVSGPEGIGKATFAYRAARFLLAGPSAARGGATAVSPLAVPANDPSARRVAIGAHPNLFVIRRMLDADGKKVGTEISVDTVRRASHFFASSAAEPGWRVAIVDAADDLNANSANALLKLVEEPPAKSVFLIVAHSLGRILPTLRSRCRLLRADPLSDPELSAALADLGVEAADIPALTASAPGSVRKALAGAAGDLAAVSAAVEAALAKPDTASLVALAERLAGTKNDEAFQHFVELVLDHLSSRLRDYAHLPAARLEPLAELWKKLNESRIEIESYNVDRRPFVASTLASAALIGNGLRALARESGRGTADR